MRLVMMCVDERAVFGSEFADVSFAEIAGICRPARSRADRRARVLARSASRAPRARQAVGRLVAHFRGFAPSEDRPKSVPASRSTKSSVFPKRECAATARTPSLSPRSKRHSRSLVRNEAHAWVEVFDGRLWHLVDLGGAAGRLDYSEQPETQLYRPPTDPYRWPEGSESGQQMVERSMAGIGQQPGDSSGNNPSSTPSPGASAGSPFNLPVLDAGTSPSDTRDRAHFELTVSASEIKRGTPLAVTGRVDADGEACQYARVDIALGRTTASSWR